MDNASEEQSKKMKHDEENEETATPDLETNDELVERETTDEPMDIVPEFEHEKINDSIKNNKKGANNDRQNEVCETKEECNVDGDTILTHNVSRPGDTTAHCSYVFIFFFFFLIFLFILCFVLRSCLI